MLSVALLLALWAYPRLDKQFRRATLALTPVLLYWLGYAAVMGGPPSEAAVQAAVGMTGSEFRDGLTLGLGPSVLIETALLAGLALARPRERVAPAWQRTLGAATLACVAATAVGTSGSAGPVAFGHPARTAVEAVGAFVDLKLLNARQPPTPLGPLRPGVFVFVVGESTRWDAFFGTARAPSPAVQQLRQRLSDPAKGWALPPVCASSNSTYRSVPLLLTGYSPAEAQQARTAASVFARAHASGAQTVRISNQALDVFVESSFDTVVAPPLGTATPDGWTSDALGDLLRKRTPADKPLVVFLHLMQAHFEYFRRYPGGDAQQRTEDEHYDQAVDYSAQVLLKLLGQLDALKEPALLTYVSDHGEGLRRDQTGLLRHLGPVLSPAEVWVPAFVAYNAQGSSYAAAPATQPSRVAHRSMTRLYAGALTGQPFVLQEADLIRTVEGNAECKDFGVVDASAR